MQLGAEETNAARQLVRDARTATLATIALRPVGYPFATLVAVASDEELRPVLLLSKLAEHTKNLDVDPRASLLFADHTASDPLAGPRVTIVGFLHRLESDEVGSVRDLYLAKHPAANQWVTFADFGFFRLEPQQIRFVAGFGKMGWIAKDVWPATRRP